MPHSRAASNASNDIAFPSSPSAHDVRLNYPSSTNSFSESPKSDAAFSRTSTARHTVRNNYPAVASPSTSSSSRTLDHPYSLLPSTGTSTSRQSSINSGLSSSSTSTLTLNGINLAPNASSSSFWTAPDQSTSSLNSRFESTPNGAAPKRVLASLNGTDVGVVVSLTPSSSGISSQTSSPPTTNDAFGQFELDRRRRETAASFQSMPLDASDENDQAHRWSNAPAGSLTPATITTLQEGERPSNYGLGMRVSMLPGTDLSSRPGSADDINNKRTSFAQTNGVPPILYRNQTLDRLTPVQEPRASLFYDNDDEETSATSDLSQITPTPASRVSTDKQFYDYQGKRKLPLPGQPSPAKTFTSTLSPVQLPPPSPNSTISSKGKEREIVDDVLVENGGWGWPGVEDDLSSARRRSKTTDPRRWSTADMLSDRRSQDLYAGFSSAESTSDSTLELSAFPAAPTAEKASDKTKARNTDDDDGLDAWRAGRAAAAAAPPLLALDFDFNSSSLFSDFDLGLDSLGAGLKFTRSPTPTASDASRSSTPTKHLADIPPVESRSRVSSQNSNSSIIIKKIKRNSPPTLEDLTSNRSSVMTVRRDDTSPLQNVLPASVLLPNSRPSTSLDVYESKQTSPNGPTTFKPRKTHSRTISLSSQISAMLGKGTSSAATSTQHSRNPSTNLHYNTTDNSLELDRLDARRSEAILGMSPPQSEYRKYEPSGYSPSLSSDTRSRSTTYSTGNGPIPRDAGRLAPELGLPASTSRRGSMADSDVNKSLPPTPGVAKRIFSKPKGPRPSLPERTSSIRKTSANAAANLFSMGKSLMSRSHNSIAELSDGAANERVPKSSTASTLSNYRNGPFSQSQESELHRQSGESGSSGERRVFSQPARLATGNEQKPKLSFRRSIDMLKSKAKLSSNSTDTQFTANSDESRLTISEPQTLRSRLSTRPPAPIDLKQTARRPSTDKLLLLASEKLAKLALDRSADSSVDSHATDHTPISPVSTVSTDISLATQQAKEASEPFAVAHAVRITRQNAKEMDQAPIQTVTGVQLSNISPITVRAAPKLISRRQFGSVDLRDALSPTSTVRQHKSKEGDLRSATLRSPSVGKSYASQPITPQPPAIQWKKRAVRVDSGVGSDAVLSTAWLQLEDALMHYAEAYQAGDSDRPTIVQTSLQTFLKRAETGIERVSSTPELAQRQREILFGWLNMLLDELKMTPANRGVCLDGVAAILESHCLSSDQLTSDRLAENRFRTTLISALAFAIEKLNEKAVYANTLSFSGRLFAVAFFRIEGVGLKLLRLLPQVKRQDLKRIVHEVGYWPTSKPPVRSDIFPSHLEALCYKDVASYANLLSPLSPSEGATLVQSPEHAVKMQGNWLIRWQASDSDLPFAFYRAYHRQLASYLEPVAMPDNNPEAFLSPYEALSAPGFLFLAASLLEKVDSLVHRNLRSVTTLGPNNGNFNTQDSANMSMGQKPKVLEMANRRVVSTILDVVGGPAKGSSSDEDSDEPDNRERRRFFGGLLQVILRAVVKRTSLFDARGIFLLLDFIEGLFYTVCATPSAAVDVAAWHPDLNALALFDTPFILDFLRTILLRADNTIVLMRTFTFLYAQFESFTSRTEDRLKLCQRVLLHPDIFQRTFLFWNMSVRGYFLRLIVWRVSRLGTSSDGRPMDTKDPITIGVLQTLNTRLETIRKRHDEIDPLDDLPDDDLFDPSRASVDSTRGVMNQLWVVEELLHDNEAREAESEPDRSDSYDKISPNESQEATRMSNDYSDSQRHDFAHTAREVVTMSKVANWLKVLKPSKKITTRKPYEDARIQPFTLQSAHTDDEPATFRLVRRDADGRRILEDDEIVTEVQSATGERLQERQDHDAEAKPFPFSPTPSDIDAATFFQFEFEGGSTPVSAVAHEGRRSTRTSLRHGERPLSGSATPRRPGSVVASPRVSKRFSKRASILPPPALDLLLESREPVPQIPKEYQDSTPYPMHQHAYAIRGLREYEDALDEYDVWIARVLENAEDLDGREQAELVPRLSVLWPLSFSDEA